MMKESTRKTLISTGTGVEPDYTSTMPPEEDDGVVI
jgi:hypothetical protein